MISSSSVPVCLFVAVVLHLGTCYPLFDGNGHASGSVMDQLYDEIQGYVDQKRSGINRIESLNVPLNEDLIPKADDETDLAVYPGVKKTTLFRKSYKTSNHSKFIEKIDIEKELVNVTVKIPIFQASDKTKHQNRSSEIHRKNKTSHNVKLLDISVFNEETEEKKPAIETKSPHNTTVTDVNTTVIGVNNNFTNITNTRSVENINVTEMAYTNRTLENINKNDTTNVTQQNTTNVNNVSTSNHVTQNQTNIITLPLNSTSTKNKPVASSFSDNSPNLTVFGMSDERSSGDTDSEKQMESSGAIHGESNSEKPDFTKHQDNSTNEGESEIHMKNAKHLTQSSNSSAVVKNMTEASVYVKSDGKIAASDTEGFSGEEENSMSPLNHTDKRVKRDYYWDHNSNQMELDNNPSYYGGDFMHGGAHDEFHNIDESGSRLDLGQVDLASPSDVSMNHHPHLDVHEEPHFHHYEPHNEYTDVHNEPQYYSQQVHHEPHLHNNFYHDEPHFQHDEHHFHDNHQEHFHHEPHYLHNEVHIHHNHENEDDHEEHHSGDWGRYNSGKFHHVKVKLHGPGKTPEEWHQQEMQENQDMPGENDELNNYDTGAGFFQLDENGGEVEITSMHKTGTKVHMGGGQFSVIRDPWRYHSAFAGMLHPHEHIGTRGVMGANNEGGGIQQFHQHFTYINNNRNENHKIQNLVHHEHEPEIDHHEHHYEEHHDDHSQHHDHLHHGDGDHHDDDHHQHHHEEGEDHHHYEEHRTDDHHLTDHPDEKPEQGYQRQIKIYPGNDVKSTEEENGTPVIDNYRSDRTPKRNGDIIRDVASITPNDAPNSGSKRSSSIFRDASSITPKAASINYIKDLFQTENALKRDDLSTKESDKTSLADRVDVNGARDAFFKGLQHEAELEERNNFLHSGNDVTDDASGYGEDENGVFEKPSKKTSFENHAETKQTNIMNIQQFNVQGPKSMAVPQSWVSREFVEPISPMVVKKRSYVQKDRKGKIELVFKTFFRTI